MATSEPTVYVVDDDSSVLLSTARLLRSVGYRVATFDSATELLKRLDPCAHGCIILDVAMPELTGLELQDALLESGGSMPIIFLTGRGDIHMSVRAMKQGAVDFLTKPTPADDLIAAVQSAIARDRAGHLARTELANIRRRLATLTPREYEVLLHVAAGKLNKQTAYELGTVEKTIKVHRGRVMEKMGVHSAAELALQVERAGLEAPAPVQRGWTKGQLHEPLHR